MQNRILGWSLFFVAMLLILVKFLSISSSNLDAVRVAYGPPIEIIKNIPTYLKPLLRHFALQEPFLLFISLLGFAIRGKVGWILSLIFPYAVFSFLILNYGDINGLQIAFALIVIGILNFPATRRLFNSIDLRTVVVGNFVSVFIGFGFWLGIINFLKDS